MNRRHIVLLVTVVAATTLAPAMAMASPAPRRVPTVRIRRLPSVEADAYARKAEAKMAASRRRILDNYRRVRMTSEQRSRLYNDLSWAIKLLRHRIAQRGADGWITAAERREIGVLHRALQRELRKAHGTFDSWRLL